jgi:carbonic anhydrase/acetyltransferase-like protein (isoleucine patch superfamily)
VQLPYFDFVPALAPPFRLAPGALAIGRTVAGRGLTLGGYAIVRGDGEWIRIGANVHLAERATVHIADGRIPTEIGNDVTVGRYALVHACALGEAVVVAEGATVMDGATVGPGALIGPDALVPPRKLLEGGRLYVGNPAAPVRDVPPAELAAAAATIRAGTPAGTLRARALPPLDMAPFLPQGAGPGPLHPFAGRTPQTEGAFVAPGSAVVGDVRLGTDAGIFFGCAVVAGGARIEIGARSNIQDNCLLVTERARGDLRIGERVTVGHNDRIGSGVIEDDALIGMGSIVGDGVRVERGGCIGAGAWVEAGTLVRAGWIWAGRPARAFRAVKPEERVSFDEIVDVYAGYSVDYRDRGTR